MSQQPQNRDPRRELDQHRRLARGVLTDVAGSGGRREGAQSRRYRIITLALLALVAIVVLMFIVDDCNARRERQARNEAQPTVAPTPQ